MAELVKFYENIMTGIPQLANVQGSMIGLLDAILVNGFNEKVITSIVRDGGTAVLSFNNAHGFSERQVITIAGTTNGWNGEYRIISLTPTTLTIECGEALPVNSEGTASCKAAPMGFEILFTGTNKRAYRSLNPESLGLILRVVDEPKSTLTGAKFAKVGVVASMSDINTITGTQMPYNPSNPNENWQMLVNNYEGWAKWYYALNGGTALSENFDPGDFNRAFTITGNSLGFVLYIETHTESQAIFGFTEFYDSILQSKNLCLLAGGLVNKVPSAQGYSRNIHGAVRYVGSISEEYGGVAPQGMAWFDVDGFANAKNLNVMPHLGGGNSSTITSNFSNNFVCAPFILLSGTRCLGALPFLKIQLSSLNGNVINGTGRYRAIYKTATQITLKFALSLEEE